MFFTEHTDSTCNIQRQQLTELTLACCVNITLFRVFKQRECPIIIIIIKEVNIANDFETKY